MKLHALIKNYFFLCASVFIGTDFFYYLHAIPMNTYHDPLPLYSVTGNDFFATRSENKSHSIEILPFYYTSSGAKNSSGKKVPAGDRLGRWSMIGLLHGTAAAPGGTLPTTLLAASTALGVSDVNGITFTDDSYTDSTQTFGYFSVPSNIESEGVRLNVRIPLIAGLIASFRSGFVHYTRSPQFVDQTVTTSADGSIINVPSGNSSGNITLVRNNLMNPDKRNSIAKEIGLSLTSYSKTALEDSIVELSWGYDFWLNDEKGNHRATIIPTLAIGVTLPTGEKKDESAAFSLPTGNNGHLGILARANLECDFEGGVGFAVGGDVIVFEKKEHLGSRIPTSWSQQGIYPWTVNTKVRPGVSWSINAGLIARHFSDTLSGYVNFIYSAHEKDSISLLDNSASPTRNANFIPAKAELESRTESKMVNIGFDFNPLPELAFGFAAQTPLTGRNIFRTTTLMGTFRLLF